MSAMKNELLRHTLATILYRFEKAVSLADDAFGQFSPGQGSRSVNEIIHHMFRVLLWASRVVEGKANPASPTEGLEFMGEKQRFLDQVRELDRLFSTEDITMEATKKLLQGPLSDVLTHIGQIAMLSRLYGRAVSGEDFSVVDI